MPIESFYTDLVIDTPESAKALAEVLDSEGTYVWGNNEFVTDDPVLLEGLKRHLLSIHE